MDCPKFDVQKSKDFIKKVYEESLIPSLVEFIKIPNLSRGFDPEWATNGLLEKAAEHIKSWVEGLQIKGLKSEIIKHEGYSPLIFTEVAGDIPDKTIMFYGHFDKQPPFVGWSEGKGPTTPVIEDGKLYGRGGADDGYSTYSSMLAVKAVQEQGFPLPSKIYNI
jgi:acetylornithine deacetylase/succinyl-diaminopimelate desuccinylase-like protein